MNSKTNWINRINYKDIIIIYTLWFFTLIFNRFFDFASFMQVPALSGFFDLLFHFAARLIFISLIFLYFVFIYDLSFKELGISFKSLTKKLISLIIYLIILLGLVILLINFPLSTDNISRIFKPLYKVLTMETFVRSTLPLILVFPIFFIIAFSEQLMLNLFVYEVFNYKLPKLVSKLMSALFFSFLIYHLSPDKIIIYFIFALISVTLYALAEKSILVPSFFGAGFYLIYTFYIYGWNFI